ncbi:F420-dependent NADP oxidoreductase [Mycobacterium hodleri]|uniref:F420-dependent NADP oxidoreductase n=1 Tax=Mycolicibacterium hodleri TaxID=49897 RepID=A0A502EBG0_9MYCO|nr:F420-dependent NADP oxidoreductase [Mycolicibacterium hodleri]
MHYERNNDVKIGIIGAGNLGTAIGHRLAASGHDIMISFARTPEKVEQAAQQIGHDATAGTPEQTVAFGDVIVLATPWGVTLDTVAALADALAHKVVWDTTNPFAPTMDELVIGTTTSAGEQVAATAPHATVVKAIAPFAQALASPSTTVEDRHPTVFVCGDDESARHTVATLVADIGADPVDTGPLKLARFTEPTGMLVTNLAYVKQLGPGIALALLGR